MGELRRRDVSTMLRTVPLVPGGAKGADPMSVKLGDALFIAWVMFFAGMAFGMGLVL